MVRNTGWGIQDRKYRIENTGYGISDREYSVGYIG